MIIMILIRSIVIEKGLEGIFDFMNPSGMILHSFALHVTYDHFLKIYSEKFKVP